MSRRLSAATALAVVGALAVALAATAIGQSDRSNRVLFAVMTGNKEIGPNGEKKAGDLNGRGSFSATVKGDRVCWGMTVKGIAAPIAAHIHEGSRNVAGPVRVTLQQPADGDQGASSGCVTTDEADDILRRPSRYYVNVHNQPFPGGAVRGQLFHKNN